MQIDPPTWSLKQDCPCCRQGWPDFSSCPECQHVVLICPELGTIFPDVHDLSRRLEHYTGDKDAVCPSCRRVDITKFRNTSSAEILALGFTKEDYA